ncbi:MAG: transglutaminase domain-containing protein [Bacteroidales bacterium]|nr:transglutaminase domain-containing protein [Bacteroidales bacterium]
MIKKTLSFVLAVAFLFSATAQDYRREYRKVSEKLTKQEQKYLDFLYDYMPLNDIADYDSEFFLEQVRTAIKAKKTFSWGKKVPEDIFKHYVLVYRVNNENLDTARTYMFNELKDRIKGMSMYRAALEVNHWCHEKVNYKAADGRTSSPLATMKTSWGRCGEESTFTVTALRSVGIPARQCYTPRWAHTDDNHAWVEVWIDGKWYYLGACEPEPELNFAWFDAPVKRAMMVHTTVFGKYNGKEQKNYEADLYSKINLLSNYTATKKLSVIVKDENGNPIEGAKVEYGLYNYAEFYPLATLTTNKEGKTVLETGFGDLMIWASKGNLTAQAKAEGTQETVNLTLKKQQFIPNTSMTYVLYPPVAKSIDSLTQEQISANAIRLAFEDSIRTAYINTFAKNRNPNRWIKHLDKWNVKKEVVEDMIVRSWGNYDEIEKVLESGDENAVKMLSLVYDKDLRDGNAEILLSHLKAYKNYPAKEEALVEWVLNPRIQLEKITPYREYLQEYFKDYAQQFSFCPQSIADWINSNIKINNTDNYYGVQISPKGVLKIKECDKLSRELLFVAIARSFGIAARYEWAVGKAQFKISSQDDWQYPIFETDQDEPMGRLIVDNSKNNRIKPEYYINFTIQRLLEGRWQTLDFEYDPKFQRFPEGLDLAVGTYRLMSGNRDVDGNIYVREDYFTIEYNKITVVELKMEEIKSELKVLAKVDINSQIQTWDKETVTLKDLAGKKGMILAIIDPYSEPVRHLMADLPLVKKDLELWGGGIAFCFAKMPKQSPKELYENLPKQSLFAFDTDKNLQNQIVKSSGISFSNSYPILCFVSEKGEVYFLSTGYRIGSGESLLKIIHQLEQKQ